MNASSSAASRVGFWSAICCTVFSLAYVIAQLLEWQGLLGSAGGPGSASTSFGLAILLTPSLLLGSSFLVMMSALHTVTQPDRKVFSQVAISFAVVYGTLTGLVYYVQLTFVAPQIATGDASDIKLLLFVPYRSFLFAIDMLGYSMMSLSTLFGAFALPATRGARFAKAAMLLNGALLPFLVFQMFLPDLIFVAALWAATFPCLAVGLAFVFIKSPLRPLA